VCGWDLRPEHAHPDVSVTNRAILDDIEGGATSLLLRLDDAARRGIDPDQDTAANRAGRHGIMAYSVDDLDAVLANVQLDRLPVALDAGAAFLPAAALLVALWQRRSVSPEDASGALNADPLATLAREGDLPVSPQQAFAQLADLARWTADNYPRVTSIGVDTSPYHDAGATAAQDVAFATATAVEYMRAVSVDVDTAASQMLFRMDLGTHHFLAIAKLRAARRMWSRVVQASGGSPSCGAMRLHARTSRRVLTCRDPHVNLLRNTVAVFAAGLGGADAITSVPFDATIGLPSDFSRRVARNTVLVLQDEAGLHRVMDPAGGSWFLEQLTERLAERAWELFQETERQGGMLAALQSGWITNEIDAAYAPRAIDIARRKQVITGVSEFPDVGEQRDIRPPPDLNALHRTATERVVRARADNHTSSQLASATEWMAAAVPAATQGATIGQLAQAIGFRRESCAAIPRLEPRRFAEPFERLRDASDAWAADHGQRPRVFLAKMGPVAHHIARATYAKSFFEAGGFEVIAGGGCDDADAAAAAFVKSGANIGVICSSDQLYPEMVPHVARRLKLAGARSVVLAGHPGDHSASWQAAGVDHFIFGKCDVLEMLRTLLLQEGVW
jgi:methylmalonyl-CoA mutase